MRPDIVIAMIDGRKHMVEESSDEIVACAVQYRAAVLHGVAPDRPTKAGVAQHGDASIHLLDEKRRND